MPSDQVTRTPASRRSPALTIALAVGILGLLLLIAPWPGKDAIFSERKSAGGMKISDEAEAGAPTSDARRRADAATDDKPGDSATTLTGAPGAPTTASADTAAAPATPAVALAEDGTPLWKTKRADASGSSLPESEYQRQTRIWLEGAAAGRDDRVAGRGTQSQAMLEETSRELFPDDSVGQLLWQIGHEWGYQAATNLF